MKTGRRNDGVPRTVKNVALANTLVEALEAIAIEGGVGFAQAVEDTLAAGVGGHVKPVKEPFTKHRKWHLMLEYVLEQGTPRQKTGIQSNLEAFIGSMPSTGEILEQFTGTRKSG